MKRTKVICTIGPSVDSDEKVAQLIEAGMDVARLNFSHGTHEEQKVRIERLRRAAAAADSPCAIMLDTKGPEIRTGPLEGDRPVELAEGAAFVLTAEECSGTSGRIAQTAGELLNRTVEPGMHILLDDGLIALEVMRIEGPDIVCRVLNGGELKARKSVNVPGVDVPLPPVTEKDYEDLLFGIRHEVDFIAASFVKNADAIREIKRFLRQNTSDRIGVIAKIENAEAVQNIREILEEADGIMVARGDLGVEVPPEEVPHLQKRIVHACNDAHKPVIIATQMLESMTQNPRPTRAEATDVANAIYDGADCVMLSGETAAGAWPIEAVKTMCRIAEISERHCFEDAQNVRPASEGLKSVSHAVGTAAVETAKSVGAKCLVCPTMTGRSARLMSSLRPRIPIYAVAPSAKTMRSMQLFWGVQPLLGDVQGDMRNVIDQARDVVFEHGFVESGDIAVFTVGDKFTSPLKRDARGNPEKFAPANVMYVVQIRDEKMRAALGGAEDALMSHAFFERQRS